MWKGHDGPGARREEQLLLPGVGEWQVVREVMNADPRRGAGGGVMRRFLRELWGREQPGGRLRGGMCWCVEGKGRRRHAWRP